MSTTRSDGREHVLTALFVCLIAMNLLSSTMAQMNTAGSPLLVTSAGGPTAYGGFLVSVFVIASIPARMASGALADRYSRRAVLLGGALVYLAGAATACFIPTLEALLPARVLQGAGYAAVHTAASTCASDVLPRKRLGEGLGYYGLGHALAMAAGPTLAIGLVGSNCFEALAAGSGILAAVVFALSFFVTYEKHPESLPESSGYRAKLAARNARWIEAAQCGAHARGEASKQTLTAAALKRRLKDAFDLSALRGGIPMFLISGCIVFFLSFANLFAQTQGYAHQELLFVFASATAIIVRFCGSLLIDRLHPLIVFALPVCAGALALASVCFIRIEWVFYLSGIGYGTCLGFAIPLLSSIAVKLTPPERWGAANALFFLCYDIGVGAAAVGWGMLLDRFGFDAVFAASAASLIGAIAFAALLFPRASEIERMNAGEEVRTK